MPIINENDSVATSEIKFGDNDTLSAWTGYLMDADALVILTDIDGLYTADPRAHPEATRISQVARVAEVRHLGGRAGTGRGTGGMVTKLQRRKSPRTQGLKRSSLAGAGRGSRR